jgi:hypothetical protein
MAENAEPPNFWTDDILDRRDNANYLTTFFVNRYRVKPEEQGFVMAINAEWGYGKTFMLERWRDELCHSGHPTVYFDAWKNDFTPQPLIAFISEIDSGLAPHFAKIPRAKKAFKVAMDSAKPLLNTTLKVVGASVAKQVAGLTLGQIAEWQSSDESKGAVGEHSSHLDVKTIGASLESAVTLALKQHKDTKTAIRLFRQKLEMLIDTLKSESLIQLPIFVFVDELDRCRPDYAIELLEGIKHLFGVRGIYFIVATNIQQLAESTKVIYGSGFDGENYLKRFFDLEYALPEPSSASYAVALWSHVQLPPVDKIVMGGVFLPNREARVLEVSDVFEQYVAFFDRGLRDQAQIMKIVEASLLSLHDEPVHIHFLCFLASLYQKSPVVFRAVVRAKHLSGATGFEKLKVNHDVGKFFRAAIIRQPFDSNVEARTFNVVEIANVYFSALSKTYNELRLNELDAHDFPKNLLLGLRNNQHGGGSFIPLFAKYIDIVRHAGGFAGRE